jgi:hypothetical protein
MRQIRLLPVAALLLVPACLAMRPWDDRGDRPPDAPEAPPAGRADNRLAEEIRTVLYGAEKLELQSLEPAGIGDWQVLGRTTVTGWVARRRILWAVERGIAGSDGSVAACFRPRHAIRATHEGRTAELILCFECSQVKVRLDGKDHQTVLTTGSPQELLDRVLAENRVPLAAKPGQVLPGKE